MNSNIAIFVTDFLGAGVVLTLLAMLVINRIPRRMIRRSTQDYLVSVVYVSMAVLAVLTVAFFGTLMVTVPSIV